MSADYFDWTSFDCSFDFVDCSRYCIVHRLQSLFDYCYTIAAAAVVVVADIDSDACSSNRDVERKKKWAAFEKKGDVGWMLIAETDDVDDDDRRSLDYKVLVVVVVAVVAHNHHHVFDRHCCLLDD